MCNLQICHMVNLPQAAAMYTCVRPCIACSHAIRVPPWHHPPCHPVRFCCPARRGYSSLWNGARDVNNALPLPVLAAQKRNALCSCLTVHACVQQRMWSVPFSAVSHHAQRVQHYSPCSMHAASK
jgi:hypothetical protein